MNKLLLTFFALIFFASILIFACKTSAKGTRGNSSVKSIQSYSYRESGTTAQPNCDFTVERVNRKMCRLIKYRFDTETYTDTYDTITCPAKLLKDIEAVVAQHKMASYQQKYESEYEVMDGTSWSMIIKFTDGTKVSSYGANAGPGDDGLKIIEEIINNTKKQKNKKTKK